MGARFPGLLISLCSRLICPALLDMPRLVPSCTRTVSLFTEGRLPVLPLESSLITV
mgnify:CR=1 FL=1